MTDAEAIYTAVVNDLTLAGLIGGRIFPVILPPDGPDQPVLMPAVTYQLISQPTSVTQDGSEYRSPRWRFRIYSLVYADLIPVAKALAGLFGNQSNTPFPSSRIEYPSSRVEDHEKDTHRYWRALDVVVGVAPAGAASQ